MQRVISWTILQAPVGVLQRPNMKIEFSNEFECVNEESNMLKRDNRIRCQDQDSLGQRTMNAWGENSYADIKALESTPESRLNEWGLSDRSFAIMWII